MIPQHDDLGREVVVLGGNRGRIVGIWFDPSYAIEFTDGSRATVGADKVKPIEEEDER